MLRSLGGAWAGGVLANLLFAIVDASRATRLTVVLLLLTFGAIVGWVESREAGPWRAGDVRDGVMGWAIVAGIVIGSIAGIVLPMPWAYIPGFAALALTLVFALERTESTDARGL